MEKQVKSIDNGYEDHLLLRKAELSDMELLYKWVNDPLVRDNSFHSEHIDQEQHKRWFYQLMNDKTKKQFILMKDNVPIGQIRLSFVGNQAEISYSISSEYRGQGYGKLILWLVQKELIHYPQITELTARVKAKNVPSIKAFERNGYELNSYFYVLRLGEKNDSGLEFSQSHYDMGLSDDLGGVLDR